MTRLGSDSFTGGQGKFYSLAVAAKMLQLSIDDVRNAIKTGILRGTYLQNIGDHIVSREDLVRYAQISHRALPEIIKRRILLIEKDADVYDPILLDLNHKPYLKAKVASPGPESLKIAQSLDPDVIVVNITPPFEDMLVLLQKIQEVSGDAKFLAYSKRPLHSLTPEDNQKLSWLGQIVDASENSRFVLIGINRLLSAL